MQLCVHILVFAHFCTGLFMVYFWSNPWFTPGLILCLFLVQSLVYSWSNSWSIPALFSVKHGELRQVLRFCTASANALSDNMLR